MRDTIQLICTDDKDTQALLVLVLERCCGLKTSMDNHPTCIVSCASMLQTLSTNCNIDCVAIGCQLRTGVTSVGVDCIANEQGWQ